MNSKKDRSGFLLADNKRKTFFGSILRALSIDELPSLINILKGEMAVIGPRPLLVKYLPIYSDEQKKRPLVRPGLSGLAQVNGRNLISWNERFKFDLFYIKNLSFLLDLIIILRTIYILISLKPVDKSKTTTKEPFTGKN
jgi:lipopolysaccharide/colanic/teichoic acid biosynthesis glycosyltransferase